MIPFGAIILKLRGERGWSQAFLAAKLSISKSLIAHYEAGRRNPSYEVLLDCARIFCVSTDYLLGKTTQRDYMLDVSGLTPQEIDAVNTIVEQYRSFHKSDL